MSNVHPRDWDPPEHLSQSERDFLVDRAETINGVIAKSYLQVGQVLLQVKRKFKADPEYQGWFCRWLTECTPVARSTGQTLAIIAEKVEQDATLAKLTDTVGYAQLYQAFLLPNSVGKEILDLMKSGESFTQSQIRDVSKAPEVKLQAAQDAAEDIQMKLIEIELELTTATTGERIDLNGKKSALNKRLKKALTSLQETKQEVSSLEKTRSTLEIALQVKDKQIKAQSLVIENLTIDPEQKRKRALAQTVVDATKGLDLLLSSLDRYDTDKPELGLEAIVTIERKMEEVKQKLLDHHAVSS